MATTLSISPPTLRVTRKVGSIQISDFSRCRVRWLTRASSASPRYIHDDGRVSDGEKKPKRSSYIFMTNQMTTTTTTTSTAPHTIGVTCFELPLRGELLAAWLKSLSIGG